MLLSAMSLRISTEVSLLSFRVSFPRMESRRVFFSIV